MKTGLRRWLSALGGLALAVTLNQAAGAQCGLPAKSVKKPISFSMPADSVRLRTVAFRGDWDDADDGPSIVGMWHVLFTANTTGSNAIPPTVIDNALVTWHSDKTEIMNSARPAQDGDFCMGVWAQTGRLNYKLNHFAWQANNYIPGTAEGVVGAPIGPVHITENVTLGSDGRHFTGTFVLKQYDTSGNVTASFTGVLKGTRVTVETTVPDLL